MSQISPPLRILLVGCVVFLAAWMTVLKPGGDAAAPAPAPAAAPAADAGGVPAGTSAGQAVEAANGAAAAADARATDLVGETQPGAAAAPATATGTTPGSAAATGKVDVSKAGLPAPVAKAVAAEKILVLLFWNPKAADDRVVRRELRTVGSRHKKDVVVHVANVKDIARYAPVTRGAQVEQSPSVLVIGRDRKATVLEGYSDRETIRQAVFDALRSK